MMRLHWWSLGCRCRLCHIGGARCVWLCTRERAKGSGLLGHGSQFVYIIGCNVLAKRQQKFSTTIIAISQQCECVCVCMWSCVPAHSGKNERNKKKTNSLYEVKDTDAMNNVYLWLLVYAKRFRAEHVRIYVTVCWVVCSLCVRSAPKAWY